MTVFRHGRTFRYDFWWHGRRFKGNTQQLRLEDAKDVERQIRVDLAHRSGKLPVERHKSPQFQLWSEVYFQHVSRRIKRSDILQRTLRVVLGFWGVRPTKRRPDPRAPYHDLHLVDPIDDPSWLERFEEWMAMRGISGATRNSYRSAIRGMYRVALLPQFRSTTGMTVNPMDGIPRDRVRRRQLALTLDQLRKWIAHASPHVKLALAIGALAPKLRLTNILALRWDSHMSPELNYITVAEHKTDGVSGHEMVVPISPQLRAILKAAQPDANGPYVVNYRGRPVASIKTALRKAARRADVPYGSRRGATFHTLRHLAATMLAELRVPEALRKETMGHKEIRTTQIYTHLRPVHQVEPLEQLSEATPLADLFAAPPIATRRSSNTRASAKPTNAPGDRGR